MEIGLGLVDVDGKVKDYGCAEDLHNANYEEGYWCHCVRWMMVILVLSGVDALRCLLLGARCGRGVGIARSMGKVARLHCGKVSCCYGGRVTGSILGSEAVKPQQLDVAGPLSMQPDPSPLRFNERRQMSF